MDILVIPTYQRPAYLAQTLATVLKALDKNVFTTLVDDGSTDRGVIPECQKFVAQASKKGYKAEILAGDHVGVSANMVRGIEHALRHPDLNDQLTPETLIITLDSDFVVKPNFFKRLRWLMQNCDHKTIGTGFNAIAHPILAQYDGYAVKRSIGGGNQAYTLTAYATMVKPAMINNLWDWTVVANIKQRAGRLLCVTPSVCQHIGTESLLGHPNADKAVDF